MKIFCWARSNSSSPWYALIWSPHQQFSFCHCFHSLRINYSLTCSRITWTYFLSSREKYCRADPILSRGLYLMISSAPFQLKLFSESSHKGVDYTWSILLSKILVLPFLSQYNYPYLSYWVIFLTFFPSSFSFLLLHTQRDIANEIRIMQIFGQRWHLFIWKN